MNAATTRLAKNTFVYMIGTLLSKIMQVLLLPIIIHYIAASDYGYYELVLTSVSLMVPIFTLQITEGMFRFSFDIDQYLKKKVITTSLFMIILGLLLLYVFLDVTYAYYKFQSKTLVFLIFAFSILLTFLQKLARSQNKNTDFAISGVISTFLIVFCQIGVAFLYKLDIQSLFWTNIFAYFVSILFLIKRSSFLSYFSLRFFDIAMLKKLILYSIPLVPNSIIWWLISSSNNFVISYYLSNSAVGIYSMAGKFSQILMFTVSVFQLSWQENAIIESKSSDKEQFYSKVFDTYMKFLLTGYLVALPFINIIANLILKNAYIESKNYIPILLLGAIFTAFSQFYGTAYLTFKRTEGALYTTIIAATINISICFLFIERIGLYAPAIATLLAFGIQWIVRVIQVKSYFNLHINIIVLTKLILACFVSMITYFYNGYLINVFSLIVGISIFFISNIEIIRSIQRKICSKFIKGA